MSNLVSVPRNGSLVNEKSNSSLPSLASWMDDFFSRDFPSLFSQNFNSGFSVPKVNIKETAEYFEVTLAAPGLSKSDFKIDLDNQVLSISAEVNDEQMSEEERYTRREYNYSSFKRSFTLPDTVDADHITAQYTDGILVLHMPKREEAKKKPKRIIDIS